MKISLNSNKAGSANRRSSGTQFGCAKPGPDQDMNQIVVLGKFMVDSFLYESVQAHLTEVLPYLLQGGVYNSQEILGELFFADMAMPRHLPTLCLKHLAQQPGSHLIVAPFSDGGTTYFEIN